MKTGIIKMKEKIGNANAKKEENKAQLIYLKNLLQLKPMKHQILDIKKLIK
jgi:hypothetical protein